MIHGHLFLDTDGSSVRPEHLSVTRDNQAVAQHIFKSRHHAFVEGRTPQKHNTASDFSFTDNAI